MRLGNLLSFVAVSDPSSHVNPFIGTTNGGHVFPGATLPHGMVKVGPDTDSPGAHAGYDADPQYKVLGFSQMHDDGTGGSFPLSNFKIWPLEQCESFEKCKTSMMSRKIPRKTLSNGRSDDFASPGYFSTNLSSSVQVELTATRRTALHRYTFSPGTKRPRIIVDVTNDGQSSGQDYELDVQLGGGGVRVLGGASFAASFGPGRYKAYACVDFKGQDFDLGRPLEYGTWEGNSPKLGKTKLRSNGWFKEVGALLTFEPASTYKTSILVRVGVSLISSSQACANAESELPDFDFERVHKEARAAWNELLGRIKVDPTGVQEETVILFYSSLYRSHLAPADYSGENPKWTSQEPYYDSLYCNWDTYRTLYPLLSLHDPETLARVVRGMIDIQKNEGWLPECRGATVKHYVQGGSNADPILSEFFVKFHEYAGQFKVSSDDLYNALVVDAEKQPPRWDLQGRQADTWKKYNFIPLDVYVAGGMNTRHVSRTLEYAFDDFTISQVARTLNKTEDTKKYAARAANFVNVWNPDVSVPDAPEIKGMMQQRYSNMSWAYTDPRHCSPNDPDHSTCFLDSFNKDGFYEGSPIVVSFAKYSQYVPQDTAKLIDLQGGNEKFTRRLDFIFDNNYFDSTNEPSQQIPFMYHYANRPGHSTQRSRQTISQFYNTSINGLPGNDDSGAMGSYVAFYLAGLYPLPATSHLLLSSPYFPQISFFNPAFNKTTTIKAIGFNGNPANGKGNIFVEKVNVNGRPYKSNCYLDWNIFKVDSVIELFLTDNVDVTCGKAPDALPPSLSTGGYDHVETTIYFPGQTQHIVGFSFLKAGAVLVPVGVLLSAIFYLTRRRRKQNGGPGYVSVPLVENDI